MAATCCPWTSHSLTPSATEAADPDTYPLGSSAEELSSLGIVSGVHTWPSGDPVWCPYLFTVEAAEHAKNVTCILTGLEVVLLMGKGVDL